MDGFRRLVGAEEREPTLMEEINDHFSLTIKQRAIGWVICTALGIVFSFLGFLFFLQPSTFALFYTFGNIIMLASTAFIVGPMRQLKNMFKPTRFICCVVFIGSMILTLVGVFKGWIFIVIIIFVLLQFASLLYYCFSYIPYGRQCLRGICGSVVAV